MCWKIKALLFMAIPFIWHILKRLLLYFLLYCCCYLTVAFNRMDRQKAYIWKKIFLDFRWNSLLCGLAWEIFYLVWPNPFDIGTISMLIRADVNNGKRSSLKYPLASVYCFVSRTIEHKLNIYSWTFASNDCYCVRGSLKQPNESEIEKEIWMIARFNAKVNIQLLKQITI